MSEGQWWQSEDGNRRLVEELDYMRRFPAFVARVDPRTNEVVWNGTLVSHFGETYNVHIRTPRNYPWAFATVEILNLDPRMVRGHSTHRWQDDGRLCLFYPGDLSNAFSTFIVHMVGWTSMWIFSYENAARGGSWTVPEAPR